MKKHTKIYFSHFGFTGFEFIPCEICENQANDIHHIFARGMGGSKTKDTVENLMALCRPCHDKFGDKEQFIDFLISIHSEHILTSSSIQIHKDEPPQSFLIQTIEEIKV